ncbi:hypothetical protein D3C72_2084740 [compost metagenome]
MLAKISTPATAAGAKISTARRRMSALPASSTAIRTEIASCRYWLRFSEKTSAITMYRVSA